MRAALLCLFLALLSVKVSHAGPALPIHLTANASPSSVHPGEVVTVTVTATLDPGWHVYSVVPTPNGPSPANIIFLSAAKPIVPTTENTPTRKLDPNFGAVVGYHERTATFRRSFRVNVPSQMSPVPVTVGFHYQTCNASLCLPPTDVMLTVPLTIEAGPVRAEYANAPSLATSESAPAPAGSLGLFLLAALGAGLLAILTPCVFPLIPITLTSFVKQADGNKARLVRLSVTYALGIVALYVALGAIVAVTLGAAGANRIAANPWVNLGEFVLFVVFAFSFFEVITLQLPASAGALQQAARHHSGTAGLVLLGVAFVLASFTCTAPFVGTLLVAASGGTLARPLLGMTVFALAFASPFLLFAVFPQWIGRIPKSGAWLARFKATLGFIELAAALKFLSNADLVWQWKLITQPVLLAAWAVICVCAALYLLGTLRFGLIAETETVDTPVPVTRRLTALLFAAGALYCFWGLAGRPVGYLGTWLPPAGYGGVGEAVKGLPWLADYDSALAQAKAEHKLLLLNFTGYTCTNCRANETNVFPNSDVQAAMAGYKRAELYTDGGRDGGRNQALQLATFGDVALPLYGIIDPQTGHVLAKTEGLQTRDSFLRFLKQAARTASTVNARRLWDTYSPGAIIPGQPTIIDFTAKWCVNCKVIEREVFASSAVTPTLAQFTTLRSDMTTWDAPANAALQKQYGFGSLPTVLFLDRSGQEIKPLRITGRLSVADFQKRMAQALAQ